MVVDLSRHQQLDVGPKAPHRIDQRGQPFVLPYVAEEEEPPRRRRQAERARAGTAIVPVGARHRRLGRRQHDRHRTPGMARTQTRGVARALRNEGRRAPERARGEPGAAGDRLVRIEIVADKDRRHVPAPQQRRDGRERGREERMPPLDDRDLGGRRATRHREPGRGSDRVEQRLGRREIGARRRSRRTGRVELRATRKQQLRIHAAKRNPLHGVTGNGERDCQPIVILRDPAAERRTRSDEGEAHAVTRPRARGRPSPQPEGTRAWPARSAPDR